MFILRPIHRYHSLTDVIWPVDPFKKKPAFAETTYFMYVLYIDFPRNFPPKLSKISNLISRRDLWSSCIKEKKTYIDSCPEFLQHLRGNLQMPFRHIIGLLSIEWVGDGPAIQQDNKHKLREFFVLFYKGIKVGLPGVYIFDVHASKASKRLKVVLLHLWHVNVKTTGGFICISFGDFHIDKIAS